MREDDAGLLEWIEDNLGLHRGVEMLYVVDGYMVTLTRDGEQDVDFAAPTLREAFAMAREHA